MVDHLRRPNWVTAPLTLVPCPHEYGGHSCGNNMLGKIRFPAGWRVAAKPLDREMDATGQGPVKQCRDCKGWVEIQISARPEKP